MSKERHVGAAKLTIATNVILLFGGIFTSVVLARALAPEGRGELALVLLWASMLAAVGSGGQGDALTYFSAKHRHRLRDYTNTALVISIVFGCLVYLLALVLVPSLMVKRPPELVTLATLALLLIPLQSVSGVVYQSFRGAERYVAWNSVRVVTGLGWLFAVGIASLMGTLSVVNLLLGFLVVIALVGVGSVVLSFVMFPGAFAPRGELFQPLIGFGLPSMMAAVPQVIVTKIDQVVLSFVSAELAFGLYVVALSWGGLVGLVTNAAAAVMLPALVAGGEGKMATIGAFSVRNVLFFSGLSAALLSVSAPWAIPFVFGSHYAGSVPLAMVLAVAGAISSVNAVLADCLRSYSRPASVLRIESVGAFTAVTGALAFVGGFGEIAVAGAVAVAAAAACVCYVVAVQRLSGVPVQDLLVPRSEEVKRILMHAIGQSKRMRRVDP